MKFLSTCRTTQIGCSYLETISILSVKMFPVFRFCPSSQPWPCVKTNLITFQIKYSVYCYSLDISNNNLTALSENLQNIKSLQSVKISGNPYKCQCENLWIRDWLKESKIANDYLNVTCDWPSGERIYLDHLDDEDLDCSSLSGASSSLWKTLGKIFVSFICRLKQIKFLCNFKLFVFKNVGILKLNQDKLI